MPADELCLNNFWDKKKTLVVQNLVNVFSALLAKLMIGFELLDLFVFILEFLLPQFHITNTSFVKIFGG